MPKNRSTFTFEDYNLEKSTVSLSIGPLTAANFDAKRAAIDALAAAYVPLTLMEHRSTSNTENFAVSSDAVASPNAQRETKWLVTYRDDTQFLDGANTINNVGFGALFDLEWPGADLSYLVAGTQVVDLTDPDVAAFVVAFEAVQNSPTGGNEVSVVQIKHVGRNI